MQTRLVWGRSLTALALLPFSLIPAFGAGRPNGSAASLRSIVHATTNTPPSLPFWEASSRWTFGAQIGFALENDIPHNLSHIAIVIAQPSIGFTLHQFSSSRIPIERFQIVDEGILGNAVHPGGHLLGNAILFRLAGRHHGNFVPFFDFGAGTLYTTLNNRVPELSGHLQFTPQVGFGIEHFFSPQRAIVFEYRYMHMSNASLVPPNHGFNSDMITIGFRWLRRPSAIQAAISRHGFLRFFRLD